jgi:hypothetical protein
MACADPVPLHCHLQNYYDNRYWTMWKLPMFGCTDPIQVSEHWQPSLRDTRV